MKNIYKTTLSASILSLLPALLYSQTQSAAVPVIVQEQTQWCWAANSASILSYYGFVTSQCTITEYARTLKPSTFGSKNCCPRTSGVCNQPNQINYNYGIKGMIQYFGKINSVATLTNLPVTTIITELTAKRPFVIGIMWSGGGGHVVLGCAYNQTTSSLTFMDPWQNNGMTTKKYTGSAAFSTNSGSGNWAENLVLQTNPVTTGINTIAISDNVSIFPNPSLKDNEIMINADQPLKSIKVFNNIGQLVDDYSPTSSMSFSIKIPTAGFYSIQIITEKGFSNKKVSIL